MYTKEQAVKESIEKWEKIVAGEEEVEPDCGFCRMKEEGGYNCDKWCPMGKAGVCIRPDGLYQQWLVLPSQPKARKVLAGVKKYGKLWIEEE